MSVRREKNGVGSIIVCLSEDGSVMDVRQKNRNVRQSWFRGVRGFLDATIYRS